MAESATTCTIELGYTATHGVRPAAATTHGVKTAGNSDGANAGVLAELAHLISDGRLEVPIATVYPLAHVRDAYREVEQRHTRGKIVLVP